MTAEPAPSEPLVCPSCATTYPLDERFCARCGMPLVYAGAQAIEEPLTPTEVRLLGHLSEGLSYQGAAERMRISINTVRDHVRVIYEKLHVHSKSAAVSKALRAGLI